VRSTTYTTSTTTYTMSTASVCFLKNYKCSGKRRRRDIVDEPLDNANAPVLNDVNPELRELVKRTADENLLHLKDMSHIKFYPSKVLEEEEETREKREAEDEEEEDSVVADVSDDDKGRFLFNGVTILHTSTTTTTMTTTKTIGTIGITGTTSHCKATSISDFFSKCG